MDKWFCPAHIPDFNNNALAHFHRYLPKFSVKPKDFAHIVY